MKCLFCKANMETGVTTHVAELEKCIIIIRNVPCMKCGQCGETVYSGDIIQKIEEILKRFEDAMTEIVIVNYKDMAA